VKFPEDRDFVVDISFFFYIGLLNRAGRFTAFFLLMMLLDKGMKNTSAFLYIIKAFDSVNHNINIKKLYSLEF